MADEPIHTTPGAKDLFKLIIHSPALLITTLAGAGLVIFLLVKNSPQTSSTTTAPATGGAVASSDPMPAPAIYLIDTGSQQGYGPGANGTVTQTAPTPSQAQTTVPAPTPPPPPVTVPAPTPPPVPVPTATIPSTNPQNAAPQRTYTIQNGDTLSGIAARYGTSWQNLFQSNQSTIVNTSNQHGNPIAGGAQNNIFPGEVLNIP